MKWWQVAVVAGTAQATMGAVTLTMVNGNGGGGMFNTVQFGVTNGEANALTSMSLTVGDTQYLFDQLYLTEEQFVGGNGTQGANLTLGDRTDDNAGPDSFAYSFTNFTQGVTFRGQWDIDNDNGDFNADARVVMFSNGPAPNAIATFNFSDGTALVYQFPDLPVLETYTLVIPGPGAMGLAGVGMLAMLRRRR